MHEFTDLLQLLAMLCVPAATLAIAIPIGRAIARRIERQADTSVPPLSAHAHAEMERTMGDIRLAIEALAIEMERHGEAYRHALRLLESGRNAPSAAAPRPIGAITPH